MKKDILRLAAELTERGEPFVLAVVVRREGFSSAQPGDAAVVTADGAFHGWLGGSCTRPAVEREAARVLADGKPRLVSLSPLPDATPRPGVIPLPMTCHSGGTVDIYLEPVLPAPRLVLFGASPIARAASLLGKGMGYAVDVVDAEATAADFPGATRVLGTREPAVLAAPSGIRFAVVATMGEDDEGALEAALALRPAYLGVVASRKRFAQMREHLEGRGVPAAGLDAVHNPAGLDLGARGAAEVALSILAEIVSTRRAGEESVPVAGPGPGPRVAAPGPDRLATDHAIDPVCHMQVVIATARHTGTWSGTTYYFCNPRCKERFLAEPLRYLEPAPAAAGGHA